MDYESDGATRTPKAEIQRVSPPENNRVILPRTRHGKKLATAFVLSATLRHRTQCRSGAFGIRSWRSSIRQRHAKSDVSTELWASVTAVMLNLKGKACTFEMSEVQGLDVLAGSNAKLHRHYPASANKNRPHHVLQPAVCSMVSSIPGWSLSFPSQVPAKGHAGAWP